MKNEKKTEPVLLKQYKLLGAVIDAKWATRLDCRIARHVIDRYWIKYGVARASLRYLEQATGSGRGNIIKSLRRLLEHEVIAVVRLGRGTRATEYDLNFRFEATGDRGASKATSTSSDHSGTLGGTEEGTTKASSGASENTKTYLRSMSTDMLTVGMSEETPAVPAAPPVSGLAADTAASAGEEGGFEELWAAWPRKHHRAKARAAYRALTPDAALHATLLEKAHLWAAHYEQTGIEKRYWKHLHTWLAEERFFEDLPTPFEDRRQRISSATKRRKQDAAGPVALGRSGLSTGTPLGAHSVVIIRAEIEKSENDDEHLAVDYRITEGSHRGTEFRHLMLLLCVDQDRFFEAQEKFREFRKAVGFDMSDPADLLGRELIADVGKMGTIRYKSGG